MSWLHLAQPVSCHNCAASNFACAPCQGAVYANGGAHCWGLAASPYNGFISGQSIPALMWADVVLIQDFNVNPHVSYPAFLQHDGMLIGYESFMEHPLPD